MRDVFRLARENAPAIVFIDEIDSIATKRFDAQTGADREVLHLSVMLLIFIFSGSKTVFSIDARNELCCRNHNLDYYLLALSAVNNSYLLDSYILFGIFKIGATYFAGAAKSDGRLRPSHQCEGDFLMTVFLGYSFE